MSTDTGELTMMPEVEARAALRGRSVHFYLLAPVGAWAGCGTLRVLRARSGAADAVELVCGYDSYERLDAAS